MPNYRRAFRCGSTFFFKFATYRRTRFLCDDLPVWEGMYEDHAVLRV